MHTYIHIYIGGGGRCRQKAGGSQGEGPKAGRTYSCTILHEDLSNMRTPCCFISATTVCSCTIVCQLTANRSLLKLYNHSNNNNSNDNDNNSDNSNNTTNDDNSNNDNNDVLIIIVIIFINQGADCMIMN